MIAIHNFADKDKITKLQISHIKSGVNSLYPMEIIK